MRTLPLILLALTAAPVLAQDVPVDARAALTETCMAEAKRRGAVMDAKDVSLVKLRDTDINGEGKGDLTARVAATFLTEKGKMKTRRMTVSCEVKAGVITEFRME